MDELEEGRSAGEALVVFRLIIGTLFSTEEHQIAVARAMEECLGDEPCEALGVAFNQIQTRWTLPT